MLVKPVMLKITKIKILEEKQMKFSNFSWLGRKNKCFSFKILVGILFCYKLKSTDIQKIKSNKMVL